MITTIAERELYLPDTNTHGRGPGTLTKGEPLTVSTRSGSNEVSMWRSIDSRGRQARGAAILEPLRKTPGGREEVGEIKSLHHHCSRSWGVCVL